MLIKLAIGLSLISSCVQASIQTRQAMQIYTRIAGTRPDPKLNEISEMSALLAEGKYEEAAEIPMLSPHFYNTSIKQFASRMISPENDPYIGLNDAIALIIGLVRDDEDFRSVLTGDLIYHPPRKYTNGQLPSFQNNNVFSLAENRIKDVSKSLMKRIPQWNTVVAHTAAGVLTTRGWAEIYYNAGTNRRAVKGTFQAFLCTPIEVWRDARLPTDRIRRDVDRAPGGNPVTFQTECRKCHAPMDAMSGAFAQMDYLNNNLVFNPLIAKKYNQNNDVYPDGYITVDTSWINHATQRHNKSIGWKGELSGENLESFANMISRTDRFKECMAQRVYEKLCLQKLGFENPTIKKLSKEFEVSKYSIKTLFKKVISHETCLE